MPDPPKPITPEPEHKTFTDTGEFIKAEEFEEIWVDDNKYRRFGDLMRASDKLSDSDYIDYKVWMDMNLERLYKKHLPNVRAYIGKNPNIIFHGGCLGCLSQRLHGLERCKGCNYFRFGRGGVDLKIEGEWAHTVKSIDELL